jgi:phosphoribosylformylglycinamidine cyclo-ligase
VSDRPVTYRDAGVDIDAADESKERIARIVESTFTSGTRGKFGGFGGMFRMPTDAKKPVLVSSADGVGTKIKIAIEAGRHDTIGHDLVNHCVNDILVQGAVPMFFLDYVAFGVLEPAIVEAVVSGVAAGCRENGCALLGGETAEMPGLYTPPDYDLAGFIVGYVEEDRILGPDRVKDGDVLIGLASSGLHTNGYSLARRIISDRLKLDVDDDMPGTGQTVADSMLAVHRSYLAALRPVLGKIHSVAHITGGGLPGNLNRALPKTLDAVVSTESWSLPAVYVTLQKAGAVSREEMFRTFNMGVGMVVVGDPGESDSIVASARKAGVDGWILGHIAPGSGRVILN